MPLRYCLYSKAPKGKKANIMFIKRFCCHLRLKCNNPHGPMDDPGFKIMVFKLIHHHNDDDLLTLVVFLWTIMCLEFI